MGPTLQMHHTDIEPSVSSARAVGSVKATPAGRARRTARFTCARRGLDPAERTRTPDRVAAPKIVAQSHGSPKIVPSGARIITRERNATAIEIASIGASRRVLQCARHVIQCRYAPMQKDFDRWNKAKKKLNAEIEPLYFREGEVWWVHLDVNIGYEIDGKRENFARPVIVLRKYNKYSFLALPLMTSPKPNPWKLPVGVIAGKQAFAVLSQLRNIAEA